jgi:hypothetical protein
LAGHVTYGIDNYRHHVFMTFGKLGFHPSTQTLYRVTLSQ